MDSTVFSGRVGIIQRVLTDYRRPFFDKLASLPGLDLCVFAGEPLPNEGLKTVDNLDKAHLWFAKNRYWPVPSGYLCWQSGIQRWLCKFAPDALIIEANPRLLSSRGAIRWLRQHRKPVLGWGLGQLPPSGPPSLCWVRKLFAQRLIHSFDAFIAYSSKAARDYIDMGVNPNNIFVAYNALDNSESERYITQFGSYNSWRNVWKMNLHLYPDLPIVLFVGRLLPQKRVDLLIKACGPLFPRCQLVIVGDGPAKSSFKACAKPYEKYVRFVHHLTGPDLAKCFLAADLFVLPGLGGLALYQAMSYGKPVIVSFGDGTEEDLLREGLNGVFFRAGDVKDLSKKIKDLLARPEKLPEMGKASLGIIHQERSLDAMVATFCRALRETGDYVRQFKAKKH